MLATRNLEYLLYLASLWLFVGASSLKSRRFWLGAFCLSLLVASDRLFLSLSLGGGGLALVVYALVRNWRMASLTVDWLVGSIVAGFLGSALLGLIQASGLTHFAGQGAAGPYNLAHGLHNIALGIIYVFGGLFTNFGANPAYDATVVRHIPQEFWERLFGIGGPAYLVNIAVLLVGLVAVWLLLHRSVTRPASNSRNTATQLALLLGWSTLAAGSLFVISNHYYAVDARYLTIAIFALFIAIAAYGRQLNWSVGRLVTVGGVLILGLLFGLFATLRMYSSQHQALAPVTVRNSAIGQILQQHPVQVLVGDYWRVVPIKAAVIRNQAILPLSDCTEPRSVLSSMVWQPDLHSHSFAYLLSLDRSLADYPRCSLQRVVRAYGRPNTSVLIAGNLKQPKELLLYYDHGIHHSSPQTPSPSKGPATVLPITTDQLPYTSCNGPTVMNFVAHQDDDLLFMNPELLHDIKAGRCIRTVYLTAGDAGGGRFYWLGREQGSEAAYTVMSGDKSVWIQRIVELANHEFITVSNPKGNSKISLIFMHLPDGNMKGDGFSTSHNESLARLEAGKIKLLQSVDGQSSYSSSGLQAALSALMHLYQPAEIRTQANFAGTKYPDHSDHMAVGRFVKRAYVNYEREQYAGLVTIPIQFYIGYPIHQFAAEVSGGDLQAKENAFLAYAKYDGGVCHSVQACSKQPAYGAYLRRQYTNPD